MTQPRSLPAFSSNISAEVLSVALGVVRKEEMRADEVDFYVDMAMNECQRWLEVVSREPFLDSDDFLYSLRYGTQLRKFSPFEFTSRALNRVRPCFSESPSSSSSSTTSEVLRRAGVSRPERFSFISDEVCVKGASFL